MADLTQGEFAEIQQLIGPVEREQLIHVDCFVSKDVGMFMPVTGPCYYAVSPLHAHPSRRAAAAMQQRFLFTICCFLSIAPLFGIFLM